MQKVKTRSVKKIPFQWTKKTKDKQKYHGESSEKKEFISVKIKLIDLNDDFPEFEIIMREIYYLTKFSQSVKGDMFRALDCVYHEEITVFDEYCYI